MTTRKQRPATIIRAPKDKENPYKAVRRATIEDARLSWEERGLLSYLLVKPDDWEISIPALIRVGGAGKNKIYAMISHLEELRYLEREEIRERGRFVGVRLLLHEIPLPEIGETVNQEPFPENRETVAASPLPEIGEMATRVTPFPEKRYPVNRTHTNKEDISNKEQPTNKEELGIVGVPPTPPADIGRLEFLSALCWVCFGHQEIDSLTEAQLGALTAEAKKIAGMGFAKDDLRQWFSKIWRKGWRWEKGQERPRPDEVRSSIPILRSGKGGYSSGYDRFEEEAEARRAEFGQYNPYKNKQTTS